MLYSRQSLEVLLAQYESLLKEVLQHPDSAVSELSLTGTGRALDQLSGWNAPTVDFGNETVGQHIEAWSRRSPDAVALVTGLRRVSYLELDRQANRLAHWLQSKGVTAGALVAVELPRSTDLIVAILAAWKVGAAYLPLEPDWPEKRKNALLADAQPALILHADQTVSESVRAGINILTTPLNDFPVSPIGYTPRLSDPAYVLYTSGSTGQPKGVLIGHGQLLNYVAAASAAMRLGEVRRWGLCSSVVADLGNTALFGALFNGASLHIADQGEAKNAAAFARFMGQHDIDGLKIAPSHLSALLEHDAPRLPRTLILGGEFAPRSLIERILQLAPATSIFNHYGPTETTIGVMIHEVDPTDRLGDTLPLSTVLANVSVYVLDEKMRPVAPGERGHLYVSGAQLCDGYLNTRAGDAFVTDPWDAETRLYRTGDVAAVLPWGGLELVGRADQQVKIRGFRVELGEVESTLLTINGVRQGAVVPLRSGSDVELIAYVVNGQKGLDAEKALRQALSAALPQHMLPSRVMLLTELPRLPNGKIDRVGLADMAASTDGCPGDADYQSPLEKFIAMAMADLLGRERVGPDQDFFELGGHSLLVIRLVARIRKHLQAEVDPGLVFDHASARALAAVLPGHAQPNPFESTEVRNESQ
ncbi:amino acid adenylation domain-containing protein [Pigmentiphaga litoralis]|uniref:Amino acid adenylation domain-containing protein n=1 Tax=Pigmentiphaga litoralis TaxID=516702 RepID=A0A7Y9IY06_9BURK|nr:amino acid adenylation domain-containing protein [Pigmentiphaga litoralis]NYE85102.1 amino acid adenylation domain-containing protein [Pigmentiphaga litoralis]